MSDDYITEIYRQHRLAQDKYTYFILAAAASGIVLALNRTQEAQLSPSLIPCGLAVLLWGFSFFFGCRHVTYVTVTLLANVDLIKVERGVHPEVGDNPILMSGASEGIRSAVSRNIEAAQNFAILQFRCLVAGALCYIAWHVLGMAVRTP